MRLLAVILVLLAAGCGEEPFTPRSLLDEYRVIGIGADAPAVRPDGRAALQVVDFAPEDLTGTPAPRRYQWSACLYSPGAIAQYVCPEGLEVTYEATGPEITVDLGPGGDFAGLAIPAELATAGMVPPGVDTVGELVLALRPVPIPADWTVPADRYVTDEVPPAPKFGDIAPDDTYGSILKLLLTVAENSAESSARVPFDTSSVSLDEGVAVYVRLVATVEGYPPFEAVKRVVARAEGELNANPTIVALRGLADGDEVEAGAEVELTLEVADPDIEEASDLLYSWFSSDGKLEFELASGTLTRNTLRVPQETGPLRLYVAVRDRDGGFAVTSRAIAVVPR